MSSGSISAYAVAFVVASCSPSQPALERTTTEVQIIDSAWTAPSWHLMADSGVVYRIAVATPNRRDTLTNVLAPLPVLVGDSLLVGLRLNIESPDAAERHIFRYHLSSARAETWPLPADVWPFFHDVRPSPDGRYVAYVADDSLGTAGVVRELETGRELIRGGGGGGCDCDVDLNHVRWFPPDSFEIAVVHAHTRSGWQIVAGRASTRSTFVTRVEKEPEWHDQPPH